MHKQVISIPSPNPHFNARLHCFGHIFLLPSVTTMCPLSASRGRRPTFAMAMEHVGTTMPWPRRSMEASLPSLGWGSIYNRGERAQLRTPLPGGVAQASRESPTASRKWMSRPDRVRVQWWRQYTERINLDGYTEGMRVATWRCKM
jgi:hypothetical protein